MTSLGSECYVGTLHYQQLIPEIAIPTAADVPVDDSSFSVVRQINLQTFAKGVDTALLKSRASGVSESYIASVAAGGTTFNQTEIIGEINSSAGYFSIVYPAVTNVTVSNLTNPSTYVYIDNTRTLQQQISEPTREDFVDKVFTMRIAIDTVAQTIIGFEYLNNPIGHYSNSLRDVYTFLLAQGVPFKQGQIVTGRFTDLGFDIGAGSLLEYGGTGDIFNPNILRFPLVEKTLFSIATRTTFGAFTSTDLPKFWDNSGVLTALGSTTFVGHRIYRFSNGNVVLQYGQSNWANIVLARAGVLVEDYDLNPELINATFFGWYFIEDTATNTGGAAPIVTEFREYNIGIQGGSSSGLAGCLLKGNNLSDLLDIPQTRTNLGLGGGITATGPFTNFTFVNGICTAAS